MSGSDFYDRYGAADSDSLDDDVPIYGAVTEDPNFVSPDDLPDDSGDLFGSKRVRKTTPKASAAGFGGPTPGEVTKKSVSPKLIGGVLIGVIVVAAIAISSFGGSDNSDAPAPVATTPSSDLPLPTISSPTTEASIPWPTEAVGDTLKKSGKGDTATAEGIIQQYNWAYYEGIDPDAVAETFDSSNGWSVDDVKEPVEKNRKGTEAFTETTITDDEDVFDVLLKVKVPGEGDEPAREFSFKQKYTLTYSDGRFWILDKQDLGEA